VLDVGRPPLGEKKRDQYISFRVATATAEALDEYIAEHVARSPARMVVISRHDAARFLLEGALEAWAQTNDSDAAKRYLAERHPQTPKRKRK
jgi:hypothetical protein